MWREQRFINETHVYDPNDVMSIINETHVYDPNDVMSNFLNYSEFSNCI
jgi:hypothetical protein